MFFYCIKVFPQCVYISVRWGFRKETSQRPQCRRFFSCTVALTEASFSGDCWLGVFQKCFCSGNKRQPEARHHTTIRFNSILSVEQALRLTFVEIALSSESDEKEKSIFSLYGKNPSSVPLIQGFTLIRSHVFSSRLQYALLHSAPPRVEGGPPAPSLPALLSF